MADKKEEEEEEKEDIELPSKLLETETWEKTLNMVTWNPHGSPPADIRHTIVRIVKRLLPSDTITVFLQEVYETNVSKKYEFHGVTLSGSAGKREAGVSTLTSENVKISNSDDDILTDVKLRDLQIKEEFISRMCVQTVAITHKSGTSEYANKVLMISYHAPHNNHDNKLKKSKILEFFDEMCKFADNMKKTIIIGGDFNLSVSDWRDGVQERYPERVSVATYVALPHRRWTNCIDTFAIVQPMEGGTQCSFINTIAIYPFPTVGNFGGSESKLVDYPNAERPWIKFIHYSDGDKEKIEKFIEDVYKKAEMKVRKVKEDHLLPAATPCTAEMEGYILIDMYTHRASKPNFQTGFFDHYHFYIMIPNTSKCTDSDFDADEETYFEEFQLAGACPDYYRGIMHHSVKIIRKCAPQYSNYIEEDKPNVVTSQPNSENIKKPKAYESPKQQSITPPMPLWPKSPLHRVIDHDPVFTTIKFTLNLKSPSDVNNESSKSPVIRHSHEET